MTTEGGPEPAEGTVGPGGNFQPVPQEEVKTPKVVTPNVGKSNEEVAREVISGLWGRGKTRVDRLTEAGYNAGEVSKEVKKILGSA